MPLHQFVQNVLLIGARLHTSSAPPVPDPPPRLKPIIDALAEPHRRNDEIAIAYGHRYRSGFWAIYLLAALAVLCAMLPLALGWDSLDSEWHPFAPACVVAEILVIAAVAFIYWRGHKRNWQGQWLRARTLAELTTYLPLIAPLVDWSKPGDGSWYSRALAAELKLESSDEVDALCRSQEPAARAALAGAWNDPAFVAAYAAWAIGVLGEQAAYHQRVARRSHVLRHRIHTVTTALFVLTALGALTHLVVHSRWISLITTVYPALAAALHGALAQSESYRLEVASEHVAAELGKAIGEIRAAYGSPADAAGHARLQAAVRAAVAVILQEHQDWTMLVKPHHLHLG